MQTPPCKFRPRRAFPRPRGQGFWRQGCTLGLTLLLVAASCQRRPQPSKPPALVFISQLEATLEPCGCTTVPLGGLDYMAGALAGLQASHTLGVVVLGRTFSAADTPGTGTGNASQDAVRDEVMRAFIDTLKPLAVMPSLHDASGEPVAAAAGGGVHSQVVTLGDVTIGLMQLPQWDAPKQVQHDSERDPERDPKRDPKRDPERDLWLAQLRTQATVMRQKGAQMVVLVWEPVAGAADSRALQPLMGLSGVDLIVRVGGESRSVPDVIAGMPVVSPGQHGEYLGIVYLRGNGPSPYTYFDGGAGERHALTAQAEQLQTALQSLPPGPAYNARQERLQSINQSLSAPPPAAPQTPNWQWQRLPVTRQPSDLRPPWSLALLKRFNQSLCAAAKAADAHTVCPAAAEGAATYVGSSTCQACHPAAWQAYAKSRHASAWATLEAAGKTCDLSCIGCHSVGYNQAGGYCKLQDVGRFENVGCENCHGPGSLHVAAPQTPERSAWGTGFIAAPQESTCKQCHVPSHSDQFDFATYRARIVVPGHGLPKLQ